MSAPDVTPAPWKAILTKRRASKSGRMDIRGGEHGGFVVANYVLGGDARLIEAAPKLVDAVRRVSFGPLSYEITTDESRRLLEELRGLVDVIEGRA